MQVHINSLHQLVKLVETSSSSGIEEADSCTTSLELSSKARFTCSVKEHLLLIWEMLLVFFSRYTMEQIYSPNMLFEDLIYAFSVYTLMTNVSKTSLSPISDLQRILLIISLQYQADKWRGKKKNSNKGIISWSNTKLSTLPLWKLCSRQLLMKSWKWKGWLQILQGEIHLWLLLRVKRLTL